MAAMGVASSESESSAMMADAADLARALSGTRELMGIALNGVAGLVFSKTNPTEFTGTV